MNGSTLPWSRFVAIGDSLTEGVGDPSEGSLRGWADRLAHALRRLNPRMSYWNLARRSLTTAQVCDEQVSRALELKPDLVSVVAGMNDLMAASFDADTYRHDLTDIVRPLAESEATLLMGTFPTDLPLLRLTPRRVARMLRGRLHDASAVVAAVAAEHGAVCATAPGGWRYTMSECSIDGCHPNARGHVHIAQLSLGALCARADIPVTSIDPDGCGWLTTSFGHLKWLGSQGYLTRPPGVLALRRHPGA